MHVRGSARRLAVVGLVILLVALTTLLGAMTVTGAATAAVRPAAGTSARPEVGVAAATGSAPAAQLPVADSGWLWQNPLPQGDTITDLCSTGASTVWATTVSGDILESSDGGATWARRGYEPGGAHAVAFADATIGWVATGSDMVLHTTDGGDTWSAVSVGGGRSISALTCRDATHVWASCYVSDPDTDAVTTSVARSTNAGATWTATDTSAFGSTDRLCFVSDSTGFATCGDHLLATTDGGATWTPTAAIPPVTGWIDGLTDAAFVDAQNGWAATALGRIVHTTDGGATWTLRWRPPAYDLNRIVLRRRPERLGGRPGRHPRPHHRRRRHLAARVRRPCRPRT